MSAVTDAAAPSRRGWAIAAALLAVYVVWGSTYLAIRVGVEDFPPFLMGAIRMIIPGVLMIAVLRWRGVAPPTRAQWKTLVVLSIWMVLLSNGLVNVAEQEVSSGLAAIAVASMPLWAALFSVLRGEHPSRGEWVGLGIGFAGVLWLNAGSELAATPKGTIALLIAPVAGQMLCGAGWMLVASLVTGERMTQAPSQDAVLAVLYLAFFGSIVAFTAYVWLLKNVRPALATSYAYVNPPIAVLFGVLLLGERFTTHDLGAMAVILVGVVIITLSRARK
jgi:drug/metabolite transporter (DMT)-like permease